MTQIAQINDGLLNISGEVTHQFTNSVTTNVKTPPSNDICTGENRLCPPLYCKVS